MFEAQIEHILFHARRALKNPTLTTDELIQWAWGWKPNHSVGEVLVFLPGPKVWLVVPKAADHRGHL